MRSEDALEVRSASFSYGSTPVVRDVTLGLRRGEMMALAGPNGSGKTTLLRLLTAALRPATGQALLGGTDLRRMAPRSRARRVAVVPQHVERLPAFTVRDLVLMGRGPYISALGSPGREDREAVERALAATETLHVASRPFTELSGGEQQRVVLALALAQETDFLLLDEPTVHLDLHHQHELLELLSRLRSERGIGILAILHDLNLAALYFDYLAVMQGGSVVLQGSPVDILPRRELLQVFGAPLLVVDHPRTRAPQVLLDRSSERE